jgi:hypothetical protein
MHEVNRVEEEIVEPIIGVVDEEQVVVAIEANNDIIPVCIM